MWKTLLMSKTLVWLSLGTALGIAGTTVYTKVTTHVAVVVSHTPACPSGLDDASETIDTTSAPRGRILGLSK